MKNLSLKKELLTNGSYHDFCKLRKAYFKFIYQGVTTDEYIYALGSSALTLDEFIKTNSNYDSITLECLQQLSNAYSVQSRKLNHHVSYLFARRDDFILIFCTFNFNDKALNLSSDYRKQTIRRLLSNCSFIADFIGNIDYGTFREREHYHYLIALDKRLFKGFSTDDGHLRITEFNKYHRYGFYDIQLIRETDKDCKKVAKYIAKLTNHALKVKGQHLIVKRDTDYQRFCDDTKNMRHSVKLHKQATTADYQQGYRYLDKPKQLRFIDELKLSSNRIQMHLDLCNGDTLDDD